MEWFSRLWESEAVDVVFWFLFVVWSYIERFLQFLSSIALLVWEFIQHMPWPIPILPYVVLFTACAGVIVSQILAIVKHRNHWTENPKHGLMHSFFIKSGADRVKAIHRFANATIRDITWICGISGLAFRLGNYKHESSILNFLLAVVYLPLAVLGFFEIVLRVLLGTAYLFAVKLVLLLFFLFTKYVSLLFIPVAGIVDKAMRRSQYCGSCYAQYDLPVFVCGKCKREHKKLMPGIHGLFFARCACNETFLPVMVLSGRSRRVAGRCPSDRCEENLPATNARQLFVQLIGDSGSGKTTYLEKLQKVYAKKLDEQKGVFVGITPLIDKGVFLDNVYKTNVTLTLGDVKAFNFLHRYRRPSNAIKDNLIFFDVLGETITNADYDSNPLHLGFCNGFMLFVDLTSIPVVRERMSDEELEAHNADGDFGVMFNQFMLKMFAIRGNVKRKIDAPLAVVISKADIAAVSGHVRYIQSDDADRNSVLKDYLSGLGLSNAVKSIDASFTNVAYFFVSSSRGGAREDDKTSVLAPLNWILKENNSGMYGLLDGSKTEAPGNHIDNSPPAVLVMDEVIDETERWPREYIPEENKEEADGSDEITEETNYTDDEIADLFKNLR